MELIRMQTCRFVATSLLCQNVNDNRAFNPLCLVKKFHHLTHIMTVNRSQIGQSHIFKKHARYDELLDTALCAAHRIYDSRSHLRDFLKCFRHIDLHAGVDFCCTKRTQIRRHATDVLGNRHIIIVQYNDKVCLKFCCII